MLKTNEYFDGKVKSIAFESAEGPCTIGAMVAGTYEFSTSSYEYMTVISGQMDVQFPGEDEWETVEQLETFEIEPNASFMVKTDGDVAYLCLYSETELADFHEECCDDDECGCGCS